MCKTLKCLDQISKKKKKKKKKSRLWRSKAVLLLRFTISVIVCLCMYVLVKFLFLFWIAVWPIFGKETVFFGFLLVVFCKTLTSGLGLDDMSLAWPAVVQLLVFIYSGIQQK